MYVMKLEYLLDSLLTYINGGSVWVMKVNMTL